MKIKPLQTALCLAALSIAIAGCAKKGPATLPRLLALRNCRIARQQLQLLRAVKLTLSPECPDRMSSILIPMDLISTT